ncbi:uncharacterized protein SCHCODRAFT_02633516 [Schizophyllum commune H4-8]|uniref:uncharacterized protein n=1 Tax=Schizophyllum commune (strain H4-8 / FGSC 9210) TaxID=578458 RepID=UPI00215EEBE8|nr:uncharacterized protein SCHCODRAFT_02633516 [Schizophyllum commune H4-8]KAI5889088.1 hypothetical protein SCHCODRAFT_02633516 [Schizophyllum commune H4-8]
MASSPACLLPLPAVCSLLSRCCLLMNAPRPPARPDIGDSFMGAPTNSRERLQTIWERLQISHGRSTNRVVATNRRAVALQITVSSRYKSSCSSLQITASGPRVHHRHVRRTQDRGGGCGGC